MAKYIDDQWFCNCGEEAKWYTSRQEASKGDKFIRCPRSGVSACRFFIWERDEPSERDRNQRTSQPSTPQSVQRTIKTEPGTYSSTGLPTPQTGGSSRLDNKLAAISLDRETSPTPKRRERTRTVEKEEEEEDLFDEVVQLLESEGVHLKDIVKEQLSYVIEKRVVAYETKIMMAERAVKKLKKEAFDRW